MRQCYQRWSAWKTIFSIVKLVTLFLDTTICRQRLHFRYHVRILTFFHDYGHCQLFSGYHFQSHGKSLPRVRRSCVVVLLSSVPSPLYGCFYTKRIESIQFMKNHLTRVIFNQHSSNRPTTWNFNIWRESTQFCSSISICSSAMAFLQYVISHFLPGVLHNFLHILQ